MTLVIVGEKAVFINIQESVVRIPFAYRLPLRSSLLALCLGLTAPAWSQSSATDPAKINLHIVAQPLDKALTELAAKTGLLVGADSSLLAGKQAPALDGSYTPPAALRKLLEGSGLEAVPGSNGSYMLRRIPVASSAMLPEVRVTAQEDAWGHVDGYVARRSSTATKTGAPIIETPQSISVVTADRIEALGATTLKDVLAYTPGIDIAPYGTDSRYDWISIRGFDAYSPGFYQDGLQLRNNGNWAIWQTENYGMERIEIMRGPSSVLYGQNGPGGMINVVSKKPTLERKSEVQFQLGSDDRKQLAGDFSGSLNEDGTALYRVVGLVRNANLPDGSMPDDRIYLAPSLTLKPSTETTVTLLSQFLNSRAGTYVRSLPAQGTLVKTPAGTKLPTDVYTGEPDFNHLDQDQWMLGYLLEHRANETWSFRQNVRYAHMKMDYGQVSSSGFVTVAPGDPADPANYRILNRAVYGSKEKVRSFVIDNQAQADLVAGDWKHTLLAGVDYQNSSFDQRFYGNAAPPIDIYDPVYGQPITLGSAYMDYKTKLVQTGVYLQDQAKFGNWVTTLAGRYDWASIENDDHLGSLDSKQNDGKFTGRAGLVYLHPSGWAPYASYSTSFTPTTTIDAGTGKPFDPETGRQIEAGIRYQPVGYKAMYSAAIFDLRRQNMISYVPLTTIPKQTGEITVRGLELEAVVTPMSNLNLTAAYAYTPKADVTKSEIPEEIGKQSTAVSEHRLSLWGDYRFAMGIKVGLGARYIGSTNGINESAIAKVPAYTLFDALVGYDIGRWSLALNMQNLTDKEYLTNCGSISCYYGNQRRALMTATYRW